MVITLPVAAGNVTLTLTSEQSGAPLEGAVVMLEDGSSPALVPGIMAQENRAFVPHVLVIGQGAEVSFPNRDNTQHHVYSFSPTKPFNIELYAGRPEAPIRFDQAGIVELGCNIHDQMQAFIVVADTARVARSDARGQVRFDLPDGAMPAGAMVQIKIWHPRLKDNTINQQFELTGPLPVTRTMALAVEPKQPTESAMPSLQERFRNL